MSEVGTFVALLTFNTNTGSWGDNLRRHRGKESIANAGGTRDRGPIPGSGRSPGVGDGNPLQYSCLENSMTEEPGSLVHGVTKSWTWLNDWSCMSHTCPWRISFPYYTDGLMHVQWWGMRIVKSLVGPSCYLVQISFLCGHKELDTTEQLSSTSRASSFYQTNNSTIV